MAIESLQALVMASENRDICDVIIESDCVDRGVTQAESLEKMRGLYASIRRAQRILEGTHQLGGRFSLRAKAPQFGPLGDAQLFQRLQKL